MPSPFFRIGAVSLPELPKTIGHEHSLRRLPIVADPSGYGLELWQPCRILAYDRIRAVTLCRREGTDVYGSRRVSNPIDLGLGWSSPDWMEEFLWHH